MPKVSVIIPAYNAMKYLAITVDSVLQQTFSDYEIIIVNDGSSDGIEEWAKQIKDSRVKLISQKNQGPAAARNNGIINSQGKYIAFLDADDIWEPTKLEKQVCLLEANPTLGLVYSWVGSIDEHGKVSKKIRKNTVEGNVWEKILEHNIIECGSNPIVRRDCFDNVGMFDPNLAYAQDWEMWIRIAAHYNFKVIKETLVYYRAHPNNRSKKWTMMEQNYNRIFEKCLTSHSEKSSNLENRIYGFAYIRIAWKALQSGEYETALQFRKRAITKYPELRYLRNYITLTITMIIVRIFGIDGYNKIRDWLDRVSKRLITSIYR